MNPQIQNKEAMLKESIKHFLTSYQSGSTDYSSFESIFFRLIQTMLDPPLEITWFYSAVTFHAAKLSSQNKPSTRVLIAKDLLNLMISCSNLSSASKKIGMLAPVVYELYNIVCDSRNSGLCVQKVEFEKLVDNMVSYVMMSARVYDYANEDVKFDNVLSFFEDLVQVWTIDRGGWSCNFGKNLRAFFPLLSDGIWKGLNGRCGIGELVGIVLCEVFFLRLYTSFGLGMSTEDVVKGARDQADQTITGFQNRYFLAMTLRNSQRSPEVNDEFLKVAIDYFLGEFSKGVSSFSYLISVFDQLIQNIKDPPLEIIWFYGAVTFHRIKSAVLPPPKKLSVVTALLHKLRSSSCVSSVVKKVAVMAPIIYLLYHLEINFSRQDHSLREEIRLVVEWIVSYISVCCSQYLEEGENEADSLVVCFLDLIRVWTADQISGNHDSDVLASFFPTLHQEFQQEVTLCLGYLAGVVMKETFLLRLYLKISPQINKGDLEKEMLNLAIQTIKGFQNFYFLDMLLKMLLEPSLPFAALLSSEEAILLHKAIYDAVLLVDYSFYSGRWVQSSDSRSKKLALLWVLVAERAIQFARDIIDVRRAASYLNAFCESQFVAELIKWASIQARRVNQMTIIPDFETPSTLIKWLLFLESQGIRVFDHNIVVRHAKALIGMSIVESGSHLNQNILVRNGIDLNEDQEMDDPSNSGFPATFCLMGTEIDPGRKRKEVESVVQESRIKQVKLELFGSSDDQTVLPLSIDNNGLQSRGEAANVDPDDDMELTG